MGNRVSSLLIFSAISISFIPMAMALEPAGETMTAKEWISRMRDELPKDVCGESDFVRSCYKITKKQCESNVRDSAAECARAQKPPAKIKVFENGMKLSLAVGECLSKKLEKSHGKSKSKDRRCESASHWMGR